MLVAPRPIRLFHITAIANLTAIFESGGLVPKNAGAAAGISYQNIAHSGAQDARAKRTVPSPPGGTVHDFVPFYFAPRSPMLYAINSGGVANCDLRQGDIVHFETTVESLIGIGGRYVFYDRNATLAFSIPYTDLSHIDTVVAWDLLTENPALDGFCKFWQNSTRDARYVDRMERRQAEFLFGGKVPMEFIRRIGTIDAKKAAAVKTLVQQSGLDTKVEVMQSWYF